MKSLPPCSPDVALQTPTLEAGPSPGVPAFAGVVKAAERPRCGGSAFGLDKQPRWFRRWCR